MKKWLALFLALLLFPCALAEEADRFAGIKVIAYNELAAHEIPEGELTEEMLQDLQDVHADQLFDSILPLLQEMGYLPQAPRTAFLNAEASMWKKETDSFWDLYDLTETLPAEELPKYAVHLSPDCDPEATSTCNYFAIYFFELENMFYPCPECFPAGWGYEYTLSAYDMEGINEMIILPFQAPLPGRFDQIAGFRAYFDRETDECLFIAAEYYEQGFVIIWQAENYALFDARNYCEECDKSNLFVFAWAEWKEGPVFCRNCGSLSPASEPYIPE